MEGWEIWGGAGEIWGDAGSRGEVPTVEEGDDRVLALNKVVLYVAAEVGGGGARVEE